jgi:hypothetical protein
MTRTVILAADGRFTAIEDGAVEQVRAAMAAAGITSWLATMAGAPYGRRAPTFAMVEPIHGAGDFAAAVAAMLATRAAR